MASDSGTGESPRAAEAAVLQAVEARIALDDVVAIERLTMTARGSRVVLMGDVTALFAVLGGVPLAARRGVADAGAPPGEARVVSGWLLVGGSSVADGAHLAVAGAAPLDPPLPAAWTAAEYVGWSARLSGAAPRLAAELARAAFERLGLLALRGRILQGLSLPERRALLLVAAVATAPRVLIAEAPLSGLEGPAAAFVHGVLARACEDRGAIVSVSRLDPATVEGALAREASDLAILIAGELALDGPPGEILSGARLYGLTVRRRHEELRAELAARGIELRGGPLRFSAALGPGQDTREILAAGAAAGAAIVELIPLF